MEAVKINERTKFADIKPKYRSVSTNDLEKVVKKFIEAALKDNDDAIQLEMVVCGEKYYEKVEKAEEKNHNLKQILKISNHGESEKTVVEKNYKTEKSLENTQKSKKELIDLTKKTREKEPETPKRDNNKNVKESKLLVKKYLKSKFTKSQETNKKEAAQKNIESKSEFTFEAWKAEKNRVYKKILKEEKRRQELLENSKKLEREKAAQMVYLNWKRDQRQRENFKKINERATRVVQASEINSKQKRVANTQAFKEWKRSKDAKSREEKMTWNMFYQDNRQNILSSPVRMDIKSTKNINFDNWLEQVDHVLHYKYLKERRFQVKSFYCQPTYYGTAAIR